MNNEIKKPNDIFVATVMNPKADILDMYQSGINPENTSFLSLDEYKNSNLAKKLFTDEKGTFNNAAFESAYIQAANKYQEFTNKDFYKNLEKEIEYNENDIYRPLDSKVRDLSPELTIIKDTYKSKQGLTSIHSKDKSDYSIRELAQQSKIWDTKNQKWTDKSANDLGFFGSLFKEPLVYAQWEEDGFHEDLLTGLNSKHAKGEYKTNETGDFYTETLGDRDIHGKNVLSIFDVLTKDNSSLNQFDFLDSDGKEKSAWGTTFRTITQMAPYLIPGVNKVWGAVSASYGLASVMPTVYKSFEGLLGISKDDYNNQTDLFKTMNSADGFFKKLNKSTSDEGTQSMFNYEMVGTMVGDVFAQIYQQRAAASLSKIFKSNNLTSVEAKEIERFQQTMLPKLLEASKNGLVKDPTKFWKEAVNLNPAMKAIAERQSKLAKTLSLGYMALTSASDVYDSALDAGYDRQAAGLAFLSSSAAMYGIMMNNRMGDWFLDKTTGYTLAENKALMRKSLTPYFKELQEGVSLMNSNKLDGKLKIAKTFDKIKKSTKNVFQGAIDGTESLWKNSIVESVEEVSEEFAMDGVKAAMDVLSSFGTFKRNGEFKTIENAFTTETLQRYLTSAVGGFVGGALFEANTKHIEPMFDKSIVKDKENHSLIHQIANGKTSQLIEEVNKLRPRLGNNYLSPVSMKLDGKDVPVANNGPMTEGDIIANRTIDYIKHLDSVLNQEDLKLSDDDLFSKALLNQYVIPKLEESGIKNLITRDFISLSNDINQLHIDLENAKDNKELASKTNEKLKEKRDEVNKFLTGEYGIKYLEKTLFSLIKEMHTPYITLDKVSFTKSRYEVDYNTLPETGNLSKESVTKEYKEYKDNPNLEKNLDLSISAFKEMQKIFSSSIKEYAESKYKDVRYKVLSQLFDLSRYSNITKDLKNPNNIAKEISKSAENTDNVNFQLNDPIAVDLFDIVKTKLNLTDFSKEEQEFIKNEFDQLSENSFMLSELNPELIKNLISGINTKLTNYFTENNLPIKTLDSSNIDEDIHNNVLFHYLMSNPDLDIDNEILTKENDILYKSAIQDLKNSLILNDENLSDLINDDIIDLESHPLFSKLRTKGILEKFTESFNETESIYDAIIQTQKFVKETQEEIKRLPEYKSLLSAVEHGIDTIDLDDFNNLLKDDDTFKKFDSIIKNKKVHKNPLLEILKTFQITLDENTKTTIFDLLNDESSLLSKASIEKYIKDGTSYDMLKSASNVIDSVKSVVSGMYLKQNNIETPFGFNNAIVNHLNKYEEGKDADKYAVLEEEDSLQLFQELQLIKDKIEFLLSLSDSNNISKVKEDSEIRENMNNIILDNLAKLADKLTFEGKPLMANKEEILAKEISQEERLLLLEEDLYKGINTISKDKLPEVFKSIFNSDNINLSEVGKFTSFGLNKNVKTISEFDWFMYLLTITTFNSREFYERLNAILPDSEDDESYKLAPLYSQEYAARMQFAFSKKHIFHTLVPDLMSDYVHDLDSINFNIITTLGIGGAGKTAAVGNLVLKMHLQDGGIKIYSVGPSDSQASTLSDALNENLNEEEKKLVDNSVFNKRQLFDIFLHDNGNSYIAKLDEELKSINGDKSLLSIKNIEGSGDKISPIITSENFKDLNNLPKVMFIDEITWFNKVEIDLLNKIAEHYGIKIYAYGDDTQMGAFVPLSDYEFNIAYSFMGYTPKLELSIRPANNHKKVNNLQLMSVSKTLSNLKIKSDDESDLFKFIDSTEVALNYFENEDEFYGDKIVNTLSDKEIDLIVKNVKITAGKGIKSKLAIVNPNGVIDENLKNSFINKGLTEEDIVFYSINNNTPNPIQGKEHNYVIITGLNNSVINEDRNISITYKKVYTLFSRALEGSIFVDPSMDNSDSLLNTLNIKNKKQNHVTPEHFPDKLIKLAKIERKKVLSLLTENKKYQKTVNPNLVIKKEIKDEEEETSQNSDMTKKDIESIINSLENPEFLQPINDESDNTDALDIKNVSKDTSKKGKENVTLSDKTFKYMFHPFYNRLGVKQNKDLYEKTEGNFDMQNMKEITLSESDVKKYISLKNKIIYYLNDIVGLEQSLKNDKDLIKFIKNSTLFGSVDDIIKAVKNNEFVLIGKKYNEEIDSPAFKYEKSDAELIDTTLLMFGLKIKSNNEYRYISLGAMAAPKTYENKFLPSQLKLIDNDDTITNKNELKEEFQKSASNYRNLFNYLDVQLENKEYEILDISNEDKKNLITFTSGLRNVTANKTIKERDDNKRNKKITTITASELEKLIPGLKIQYKTIGSNNKKVVEFFKGTYPDYNEIKKVLNEYGFGTKDLKNTKLSDLNNKPYIVVTLTDDNNKTFSKIYVLSSKHRNFDDMLKEFKTAKENVINGNSPKSEFQHLITKPDGFKLFYNLKNNILNNPNTNSKESEILWETFMQNLLMNIDAVYKKDKAKAKFIKSTLNKLNELKSYREEFLEKSKIPNSEYFKMFNGYVNVGKEIMQFVSDINLSNDSLIIANTSTAEHNGEIINKINKFYSPKTFVNFVREAAQNNDNDGKYYYNAPYSNVGSIDTLDSKAHYMDIEFLKYFEVSSVPEMPRAVINLKNTLNNQFVVSSENISNEEENSDIIEEPIEEVEEVEEVDEVEEEVIPKTIDLFKSDKMIKSEDLNSHLLINDFGGTSEIAWEETLMNLESDEQWEFILNEIIKKPLDLEQDYSDLTEDMDDFIKSTKLTLLKLLKDNEISIKIENKQITLENYDNYKFVKYFPSGEIKDILELDPNIINC